MKQTRAGAAEASSRDAPRRFRYLALWIAGIGPWLLLLIVLSIPQLGARGLLALVPDGFLDVWPVLWTLLIVLLWSRRSSQPSAANGARIGLVDCLLVWLVGSIILVNWGLMLVDAVTPYEGEGQQQTSALGSLIENLSAIGGATRFEDGSTIGAPAAPSREDADAFAIQQQLAQVSVLLVIWTGVVFVTYIFLGGSGKGNFHSSYLAPHRAVLTTLTVIVTLAFLANVLSFFRVQERVQSLRAPIDLTGRTAQLLIEESDHLSEAANDLGEAIEDQDTFQASIATRDTNTLRKQEQLKHQIVTKGNDLERQIAKTTVLASAATSEIRSAAPLVPTYHGTPVANLASVAMVLGYNDAIVTDLSGHRDDLADALQDDSVDPKELRSVLSLSEAIASAGKQLNLNASLATQALAGLAPSGTATILWLAAFYSSFVLFPWVLLLMFLYRKRRHRAIEIVNDLWRLDPSGTLLHRALGTPKVPKELEPVAFRRILERAFSNREYVLSATLLTALTAAGWYYFLYPRADSGIADWVNMGMGIKEMTIDLAQNASPIPMGFAGAYFYVSQMLMRRYLSGDLYPSAFLQASVRMIWVFTLSVALAVLLPDDETARKAGAVIAFVTGVFPQEGFMLISSAATNLATQFFGWLVDKQQFSTAIETAPLTNLDGIDIWVESRLLEENIENVQGMATAAMEQLVVGTYYPASRIVDWVDQAVLHTHCGDQQELCPALRRVGVRTASDLLDSATENGLRASTLDRQTFIPSDTRLVTLETAIADAMKPDDDCPKVSKDMLREMCTVIWPDPNLTYVLNFRLNLGSRERPGSGMTNGATITRPVRAQRRRKLKELATVAAGAGEPVPGNGKDR